MADATTRRRRGSGDNVDTLDQSQLAAFGSSYGVGLIMSNPELLALAYQSQGWTNAHVDSNTGQVVAGKHTPGVEWDASRIALQIANTNWFKTHDEQQRTAENARLSDPAGWARHVQNVAASLTKQAQSLGADLSGVDVNGLADQLLRDNWDWIGSSPDGAIPDSIINAHLVPLIHANQSGGFSGAAGTNASAIRQLAEQYGVKMSDQWYVSMVRGLQDGSVTETDIRNQLVNTSKSAWGALAGNINDHTSVQDLASSYIQTMASTLELDPSQVTLDSPEIKQALSYIDPSNGQPRQKSLWEFEQSLRNDPRWENTKQGQRELSNAGVQWLKDFGFWE